MKTFKKFIAEADTSGAFEMEAALVAAANNDKKAKFKDPEVTVAGAMKVLKREKISGKGKFPENRYDVTTEWASFFDGKVPSSTKTPKTDIIIGKNRISLKTGNAQLMSGQRPEANATFFAAMKSVDSTTLLKKIEKEIGQLKTSFKLTDKKGKQVHGNKSDLVGTAKGKVFEEIDEFHTKFKNDLRKAFKQNSAFAEEFTFEAMTGMQKFGNNVGTADSFLITNKAGSKSAFHKVKSASDKYVKKIASQVKPDVKFKSSSVKGSANKSGNKVYSFWATVGLGVKMVLDEGFEQIEKEMLAEGFVDRVGDYYNKIKDKVGKLFNKFISFIMEKFAQAKEWIGDNFKRLMEYMDYEPIVSHGNNISW
jgi:hypothetical protein|tara:strand:- start:58 stop:1155 length:1098 start_codon:yes stop_codon:yes gene_type:complete